MKARIPQRIRLSAGLLVGVGSALAIALVVVSCGQTSVRVESNPPRGTVSVHVSDPPSCRFPAGDFKSVFVSIRSVQAHISSSADDNSGGWVELAPQLAANPVQIDLLADTQNQCVLSQLSNQVSIPVGDYQQIRLVLVPNSPVAGSPVPASNACGGQGFNCARLADDTLHQLELSSQANTGLKIPPGQVLGGPIRVTEGQHVDINIDFNTCASIVRQGNDQMRLKPTLTAGQVSTTQTGISGQIVDSATQVAIAGQVLVSLQQADGSGNHTILMQAAANANGNFNFCPLPTGMFDIVATAVDTAGTAYNATVLFGVPTGTTVGQVPLVKEAGGPATIQGVVTSTTGSAGISVDVELNARQAVVLGLITRQVAIPLLNGSTAILPTEATPSSVVCPANTNCAQYTLVVPASNPSFGTFVASGTSFSVPAAGDVLYSVEAKAFRPMSGGATTCTPSRLVTDKDSADQPLKVTGGATTTAKQLDFTGCT